MSKDYYKILEIDKNASDDDIKKSILSKAETEKNLSRAKRRLAVTRRAGARSATPSARKKALGKTRRARH